MLRREKRFRPISANLPFRGFWLAIQSWESTASEGLSAAAADLIISLRICDFPRNLLRKARRRQS
jgi:hypothetical protein